MSDTSNDYTGAGLVDYYRDYAPKRFRLANGEPVKRRSQQILAKRFRLKLIRCGNSVLIDPAAADDDLRRLAAHREAEPAPRRRGRPRMVG